MGDVDRPDVVVVGGGAAGHAAVTVCYSQLTLPTMRIG